jgi:acetyl esterase/lipase
MERAAGENVRISVMYRIIESIARGTGQKKVWEKAPEELAEYFRSLDQSKSRVPPAKSRGRFAIAETVINGCPCYFISPRNKARTDKALMFFHGGGFLYEAFDFEWDFALSVVRDLSIPVCVPVYPVFPETDPEKIFDYVLKAYEHFLASFPEAEIILAGSSAGADLALGLCHYIAGTESGLPMPEKVICVSPAMTLETDASILEAMEAIDSVDIVLSVNMLRTLPVLLDFLNPPMTMYNAPFFGDFSQFPPLYIFSGTCDIFYPQIKPFVERLRAQARYVEFFTGYRMMHGWAILPPLSPETKAARLKIYEIIERE